MISASKHMAKLIQLYNYWINYILTPHKVHTLSPQPSLRKCFKLNCHKDENNHSAHTLQGLNGNEHASLMMWHYLLEADWDTLKGNYSKLTFNCLFLCHSLSCLSVKGFRDYKCQCFTERRFFMQTIKVRHQNWSAVAVQYSAWANRF